MGIVAGRKEGTIRRNVGRITFMCLIESSDRIVHAGKSMQSAFDRIISLEERVKRLEHAVTLSLSALHMLATALQTKHGPE